MIQTRRIAFTQLELAGSGIVDRNDVRTAAEALEAALEGDGRATLLLDLRAVEDVTMKAFSVDAAAIDRLLPKLARLERVAVVGDASWLDALSTAQRSALPRLAVRAFDDGALDEARGWVAAGGTAPPASSGSASDASTPDGTTAAGSARGQGGADRDGGRSRARRASEPFAAPSIDGLLDAAVEAFTGRGRPDVSGRDDRGDGSGRTDGPGLRVRDDGESGLIVLDLDGRIGRADIESAAARLDAPAGEDVRLLARIGRFEGVEPAALLSPALWRLQREGLSRVSRAAVVTSVDWLGRAIESAGRLQGVEVRTFGPEDEAGARGWLGAATTV